MTKRFRKNLVLSIAASLVVLLLVPILALCYLDWNPHRDRLGRWISASLNRSVEIAGPLKSTMAGGAAQGGRTANRIA